MLRTLSLLFILLVLPLPMHVQAQSFMIAITPSSGTPGTEVTIRGSGAPARATVDIYLLPWMFNQETGVPCENPSDDWVGTITVTADINGRFTATSRPEKSRPDQIGMSYVAYVGAGYGSSWACFQFTVAQSRTFPETGRTLNGQFLEFWESHGSLGVFGYPITDAQNEVNQDTGGTYYTQWFERNRLELHPENRPPYDIQLGRLGADQLARLGRDWRAEGREAGPRQRCLWFPETGHNVCDYREEVLAQEIVGFKDLWSASPFRFGGTDAYARSLAFWGYPLTTAQMETNSSGDRVLTQWFERARMEWHPDKSDGTVLLCLLGREVKGLP